MYTLNLRLSVFRDEATEVFVGFLVNRTARSMIDYWRDNVVCLSVCLSVCLYVAK